MKRRIYIWLICASVLSVLTAFLLAGGGHGWVSAFLFSFLPLLITPFTTYAFIKEKKGIAATILILYVITIYVLYFKTLEEGEGYFERVFNGIQGLVILFFLCWLQPLFLNIYILFRKKEISASNIHN